MADRICSLCGTSYTDETRHDYDECVKRCEKAQVFAARLLAEARMHLAEARRIQKQDWWRKQKAKAK